MRFAQLGLVIAALAAGPALAQQTRAIDLFVRADKGHCIACHQLPAGVEPATRSNVGPRLEGARMRELGREAIKQLLDDPAKQNAETLMPPYGRHRVLDTAEIERLAEFLHALP